MGKKTNKTAASNTAMPRVFMTPENGVIILNNGVMDLFLKGHEDSRLGSKTRRKGRGSSVSRPSAPAFSTGRR